MTSAGEGTALGSDQAVAAAQESLAAQPGNDVPPDARAPGVPAPGLAPAWGWRQALFVFALALVPRLLHWWFARHTPLADEYVPDLSAYLFYAARLMHSLYFFVEPMLMSPGYALVLAPQYILFGPDIPVFVLVNAVLDAGSAALCAGLAARLAQPGRERLTGLCAGLLYALCGPLLFYALLPLGEGPAMFFLLAGLTLLLGATRKGGDARQAPQGGTLAAWLGGALLALAALNRPNLAPAVLLGLVVWVAWPGADRSSSAFGDRRRRVQLAARCLLGLVLALAPFMAHNAAVAGRPSPFGFQGGMTLYGGTHLGASGVGDVIPGCGDKPYLQILNSWQEAERQRGRELSLAEADAYWYGQVWRFFMDSPAEAAGLLARKALLLVNGHGQDSTANQGFCARFSPVPGALALPVGLVFALAAAGLLSGWRRNPESAAMAAMLLCLAGVAVFFHVTPRYRVVLLPLALAFAGAALADLAFLRCEPWREALRKNRVPLAAFALVLGASLIPLRLLVHKPGVAAQEHVRLAHFYLLKGPQALAQTEYRAALALGAPEPERLEAELAASLLLQVQDAGRSRP